MRKKILFIILILILSISLTACKKNIEEVPEGTLFTPFTVEAGLNVFVNNSYNTLPTTMSSSIALGQYTFKSFDVDRGLIVLTANREIESQYDHRYLVKNILGEDIIPLTNDTKKDKITLRIDNNIIVTTNDVNLTSIYSLDGQALNEDIECKNVKSIGDNHYRIDYDNNRSQVYTNQGLPIFKNLLSYPLVNNVIISVDDNYIMNKSNLDNYEIIDNNGYLVKSFRSSDTVKYRVEYLGLSKFLIIKNSTVTVNDAYNIILENKYIQQDVYLYYLQENKELEIKTLDVIYDFSNQYININFAKEIKKGFSYLKVYNLKEDKSINNTNPYTDYIIDSNANYCIKLEEDVYPFISFKENIGIEKKHLSSLRVVGLDGNLLWNDTDAINIVAGHNDGLIVIGKVIDDKLLYGAFDLNGNMVLEYQYDYMSMYTDGYAIVKLNDVHYRIDKDNNRTLINTDVKAATNFGIYLAEENGKKLIYNNEGTCFIGQDKDATNIYIYSVNSNLTYIITNDSTNYLNLYKLD